MSGNHEPVQKRLRGLIAERSKRLREGEVLPVASVTNHNGIQLAAETFSRQVYSRELKNYKVIKPGWYAFNPSRINVGSLARNDLGYDVCVSPMYTVFELISPSFDPKYFQIYLRSHRFMKRVGANLQGSVRDALSFDALETFPIEFRPLAEQRAAAEVVGSLDIVIARTEALMDATTHFRNAIVFGPAAKTNYKIRDVRLGEIARSLSAGVHVNLEKRRKNANEIGVLKTSAASFGAFRPEENRAVAPEHCSRVTVPVRADCIIISRINTPDLVGANVYVDKSYEDLYLPDRLWLLDVVDRQSVDVRWLALVLASERYRKRLSELATGTSGTMKYLSKALVLGLKLKVPPISEQKRIAAVAVMLDEQLAADRTALHQLRIARGALIQEVLSGREALPESIVARHRDKAGQAA